MFKKILAMCTAAAIVLCGCSKKDKGNKSNSAEENTVRFFGNSTLSQNTVFCKNHDLTNTNDALYVWDLESGAFTVFCSQPNCSHKTPVEDPKTICTAVGPDKTHPTITYAFVYDDALYEISSGEINSTEIYKADTDGQNRTDYAEIESNISELCDPLVKDGMLVFLGFDYNLDELTDENLTADL